MLPQLVYRVLRTTDARCLWRFAWNFGFRGARSVARFKRRLRRGEYFPPFLYLSIINSCNLRCQGCWVDVEAPRQMIEREALNRLITEAKAQGNSFFGVLGGEPLLHPDLLSVVAAHPDCYFQIFTNGHFVTDAVAAELRRLGNATPLISIEGREVVSNQRRGGREVFERSLQGLEWCVRHRLLTGVATSVCQTNIADLLTEGWVRELIARGVHYVWFYTYRPVGLRMNPGLALQPDQLVEVRRFVVAMRTRLPIAIIDAYYDDAGQALCPMTTGISHHISPRGDIEPCPIIQFAAENIRDPRGLYATFRDSAFLRDFRTVSAQATRGCLVLERPDLVQELVRQHGARDSTLRGTALAELAAMQPRFSQWLPGQEVPERHWFYRLAKRYAYRDFGAYRHANHDAVKKALALKTSLASPAPPPHNVARGAAVAE
jgi:MoaA/NifB/PqqE/SkfB family radical SAM enzyme